MESSEEIKQLLSEIRDIQREYLAEYKQVSQQALDLQTHAVARQEQFSRLYKGFLVAGSLLVVGIVILIFYVLSLL
jgi:hypothetical protein